ncbi:hypothetical protein F10086_169 [Staphylococcus phage vB_SauM_JDF86]|nr:hypothetical protein F10086_169 [Staphylococcus phage vB_SauM_JDF86]
MKDEMNERTVRVDYTVSLSKHITWNVDFSKDQNIEEEIEKDINNHPNDYLDGSIKNINIDDITY